MGSDQEPREKPSAQASVVPPGADDGEPYRPGRFWLNWFNLATGRLSPVARERFRVQTNFDYEKRMCDRCEEWRDWNLQHSPVVKFMRDNINSLGGDINADNINCRVCETRQYGGFDPNFGIRICANYVNDRKEVEDVLSHEAVHAYDHTRFKVNWGDLRHAACSEIRASNLGGECRFMREFWDRSNWKISQGNQVCVRRHAVHSVMCRESCKSRKQAEEVVDSVWASCYSDTRPFDEVYR